MPRSAARVCVVTGCRNHAARGSLCDIHKWRSANPWQPFYQTKEWHRMSRRVRKEEPRCRRCGAPTEEIDHIVALADDPGGRRRLDRANLQGLCRRCHDQKTYQDVRDRRARRAGYETPTR